ncbi:hypothetical protein GCM10023149_48440 [Mucilaginibacter gynuensis]|uniref:Uncharacterized protein n=1 Tax=Mucilaginibacter gynuensis TaxID=1302236 RepID=A0ABP8HF33_9SPHI
MEQKEVLNEAEELLKVAEAVTGRPVIVEIDFQIPITHNGIRVRKLKFAIRPITVGNLYRISGMVKKIPDGLIEGTAVQILADIHEHIDKLVYIAAVGIQNDENEPTPDLLDLVKKFDLEDIHSVVQIVLSQINLKSFISSIILIKGADILQRRKAKEKMSPIRPAETIAPGE